MQLFPLTYCSGQTQGVITFEWWLKKHWKLSILILGAGDICNGVIQTTFDCRHITYLFWFMQNHSCLRVRQQNLKRIYYLKKKKKKNQHSTLPNWLRKKALKTLNVVAKIGFLYSFQHVTEIQLVYHWRSTSSINNNNIHLALSRH